MPSYVSAPDDLVLHGPRVLGFASSSRIAARFGLDTGLVDERLRDYEARGWVRHSSFAGSSGWSVTEDGRVENERRLAVEIDRAGAREAVTSAHAEFIPLNRRFGAACTDWQIRPTRADPMAFNDHRDWRWDERVLRTLQALDEAFRQVCARLAECLQRFDGYAERYSSALAKVEAGQRRWVDAPDFDSCHTVWIQFHEDLLATLGLPRGSDA
ncbi:MAG: transcriptional regulator [Propionibacteriales bacterium]|nr:transcriptional regulator [Propionibacteriales bacterium]